MMIESKLEVHKDKTLREATEMAYKVFSVFFLSLILQHSGIVTAAKGKEACFGVNIL